MTTVISHQHDYFINTETFKIRALFNEKAKSVKLFKNTNFDELSMKLSVTWEKETEKALSIAVCLGDRCLTVKNQSEWEVILSIMAAADQQILDEWAVIYYFPRKGNLARKPRKETLKAFCSAETTATW